MPPPFLTTMIQYVLAIGVGWFLLPVNACMPPSPPPKPHPNLPALFTSPTIAGPSSTALYKLIPGRYDNLISLPDFLASIPNRPGGQEFIRKLSEEVTNLTGVPLPPEFVDMAMKNSSLLLDLLVVSPLDIHRLFVLGNSAYESGRLPQLNTSYPVKLPTGLEFPRDLVAYPVNLTQWLPTTSVLFGNVITGFFFPNSTTCEQARLNIVMAAVFNQLADNVGLPPTDPEWFEVVFSGHRYHNVEHFSTALLHQGGYNVSTFVTKRAAVFFGYYINDTATGQLTQVVDPVMLRTNLYDAEGNEAVLPAIHSEFVNTFNGSGTYPAFQTLWYEGDNGMGFFPGQMYSLDSWAGTTNGPTVEGLGAVRAFQMMGIIRNIWLSIYNNKDLWDDGYGISGVCDDTCGLIEIFTTGESLEYPFVMEKSIVVPEIVRRTYQHEIHHEEYSSYLYRLLQMVQNMPTDWHRVKSPDAKRRAAGTIVWEEGREPFQCVVDARRILGGEN